MRGFTIALATLPLIAGCSMHSNKADQTSEKVTINAGENGQVAFNLPFVSGSVKLPEGVMHNGTFDIDGVKMIPGGTVTGFNVDAENNNSVVNLAFKAPGSPGQVRSYFLDQFKAKGVDANATANGITGKSKDGDDFEIKVAQAGQGSQGTIRIHSND